MIKVVNGSLLDATEDILCHQVNCQGVMGSGVALALKNKYGHLYPSYRSFWRIATKNRATSALLGRVYYVACEDNHIIANIFGQDTYGRDDIIYTDYMALEAAFISLKEYALEKNLSIAMPYKIGCGLANGDWDNKVYPMIERVFYNMDVTLYRIGE